MTLKDLINKTTWWDLEPELMGICSEDNMPQYKSIFDKLNTKVVVPSDTIIIFEKNNDGDCDVSGKTPDGSRCGIEFTPWSEWLGMKIDDAVLKEYNTNEIIANCMWEMAYIGYDESKIQHELEILHAMVEDIENGKELGKRYNSVEDMLNDLRTKDE